MRYRLNELGWYQFEKLVQALLKADIGLGVECWGGYKDFGRDAYFKGELEYPTRVKMNQGEFIFQMKFIEDPNSSNKFDNLKNAIISWTKLNSQRINANTILTFITNCPLTANERKGIVDTVTSILPLPVEKVHIQDGNDVCALLDNHPDIRWAYPQILGIQDIDFLLNKEIIEKSKVLLEEAKDHSQTFVPTQAYIKAHRVLTDNYFAVLEGPPEIGKTVTAYIIALNKACDGWEVYDCRNPADFFRVYNSTKNQLFVADDAFGTTEYRPDLADDWASDLDKIIARLDSRHWFIWTARAHILKMALEKMYLKGKAQKFPSPGDVIIDVTDFNLEERALILYRHAKQVNLETVAKEIVKRYWRKIIDNPYFTPLRIQRFITETIPRLLLTDITKLSNEQLSELIDDELRNPTRPMQQSFECLPTEHKRFLFSLLDVDTYDCKSVESSFHRHCSPSNKNFKTILTELSSAFIKIIDNREIKWIHPSVRDLVISAILVNPNERKSFINNCYIDGIFVVLSSQEEEGLSPFLKEDADWEVLIKRISDIISKTDTFNLLVKLLASLKGMLDTYLKSPFKERFLKLVETVLDGVKRFIEEKSFFQNSAERQFIFRDYRVTMIEYYYKLSLLIYPDVSILDLRFLGEDLCKKAKEALKTNWAISYKINALESLLNFCLICKSYEPRFLMKNNFLEKVSLIVADYLKEIENELECDVLLDYAEDLYYEADDLVDIADFMENTLSQFNKEFSLLQEIYIENLIKECQEKSNYYRLEAEEMPSINGNSQDYDIEELRESHISLVDIGKIFDDL